MIQAEEGSLIFMIENSAIGTAIREGATLFPCIESVHVLMVALVFGSICIVDLRLVGVGSHRRSAVQLIRELLPFTWVGFVGAVITGSLLFSSNAAMYWESSMFRFKMLALLLAGLNMAAFHLGAYKRIGEWDEVLPTPGGARLAGYASIGLWLAVIFLGRWVGFSAPFI